MDAIENSPTLTRDQYFQLLETEITRQIPSAKIDIEFLDMAYESDLSIEVAILDWFKLESERNGTGSVVRVSEVKLPGSEESWEVLKFDNDGNSYIAGVALSEKSAKDFASTLI